MTSSPPPETLPEHQVILENTDWASLMTPHGTGELLPAALAQLLDSDPAVRAAAADEALIGHQNTIYEATVPVAQFVAAILDHPATAADEDDAAADADALHPPTRAVLLEWLSSTAFDADDETLASCNRRFEGRYLDVDAEMRAFRDLRPRFYHAVRPLLDADDPAVRDAAVLAAIPLAEHPDLTGHRDELAARTRRLLATSTDRYTRDRALDALRSWGHDVNGLENPEDVEARESYARFRAERENSRGWGGYTDDPPF
ncbi:hypothetical protein [Yinghuangia seranimata]|uniref:hypothetical protein n=1 Tax=Yinghuangia seranimata TaxID=408067 RepID=UPI00248C88E0|nr:hypothetical protein [Yinghuangia seranimata]MDI2127120.1 hypothetical protein [Yinghuangia seranimata]